MCFLEHFLASRIRCTLSKFYHLCAYCSTEADAIKQQNFITQSDLRKSFSQLFDWTLIAQILFRENAPVNLYVRFETTATEKANTTQQEEQRTWLGNLLSTDGLFYNSCLNISKKTQKSTSNLLCERAAKELFLASDTLSGANQNKKTRLIVMDFSSRLSCAGLSRCL